MPLGIQLLIAGLIGAGIGWLIGWLQARNQWSAPASDDSRLEKDLQQRLMQREAELNQLRAEILQNNTTIATALANQASAEKLLNEQRALHERALAEAKTAQEKALADLRDAFKALSADALKQTQPEFLRLANETFAKFQAAAQGDLTQRQQAIATLVKPLEEHLKTYQQRLQQSETAQADVLGKVKEQLAVLSQSNLSLAAETAQFRSVLKSNQARGRWGEETLRRVVEAAGMSAHCDFTEQTQAGDNRPDLVVKLPGGRCIVVDAKVPDLDFLNALDSADETKRASALAEHAAKLKNTIRQLAERDYPGQFKSALDYVVLFVPAESLFSAALEGDRELIVWAAGKKILLATPASLIALLRSVSVSWQQHAQTENAQKISEAAQELFTRVVKFAEHFEKIRGGLERANSAFNDAVGSYERMVRPSGERVQKLRSASGEKELADVPPLDATLRLPPSNS